MKIAVVTGANGFVGSAVVKELLNNDYKVYAIVRNNHSDRLQGLENIEIVSCELSEIGKLSELIQEKCELPIT